MRSIAYKKDKRRHYERRKGRQELQICGLHLMHGGGREYTKGRQLKLKGFNRPVNFVEDRNG